MPVHRSYSRQDPFLFLSVLWLKQWSNARARRCPIGRTPKISAGRCSTAKSRPPPSAGSLIGLWDKSAGQIFPAIFAAAPRAVSIYPAQRPQHRRPREFFSRLDKTSGRIDNSRPRAVQSALPPTAAGLIRRTGSFGTSRESAAGPALDPHRRYSSAS